MRNIFFWIFVVFLFSGNVAVVQPLEASDDFYGQESAEQNESDFVVGINEFSLDAPDLYTGLQGKKEIEIFIKGKRYESLRAYKLEKFKRGLREIFLSIGENLLEDLSNEEILVIFQELRDEKPNSATDEKEDTGIIQMQNMLKEYEKSSNKDVSPVFLDSDKIKTIIIPPKK